MVVLNNRDAFERALQITPLAAGQCPELALSVAGSNVEDACTQIGDLFRAAHASGNGARRRRFGTADVAIVTVATTFAAADANGNGFWQEGAHAVVQAVLTQIKQRLVTQVMLHHELL